LILMCSYTHMFIYSYTHILILIYSQGGLFFYDIFWVFGTDVMVSVAKQFDAPVKLLFPNEDKPPSLLGLGDIVFPGICMCVCVCVCVLLTYLIDYLLTYLLTHLRTYLLPYLLPYLLTSCIGVFIALMLRFDLSRRQGKDSRVRKVYFWTTFIAYAASLYVTVQVMYYFKAAQVITYSLTYLLT